jgi:hypothetical protein
MAERESYPKCHGKEKDEESDILFKELKKIEGIEFSIDTSFVINKETTRR